MHTKYNKLLDKIQQICIVDVVMYLQVTFTAPPPPPPAPLPHTVTRSRETPDSVSLIDDLRIWFQPHRLCGPLLSGKRSFRTAGQSEGVGLFLTQP